MTPATTERAGSLEMMYHHGMNNGRGLTIITGEDDAIQRPYSYSEDVKELAFLAWFQAGRRVAKAHRMLVEQCTAADADDVLPLPGDLPDESTMRRWVRRYNWPSKLAYHVREHFPAISARQAARLIAQTDDAQEEWEAIIAGERDHLNGPQMNARVALIMSNLQLRGLGTAGARGGEPVVQDDYAAQKIDISTMTPTELSRYQRQQLLADRTPERVPGPKRRS